MYQSFDHSSIFFLVSIKWLDISRFWRNYAANTQKNTKTEVPSLQLKIFTSFPSFCILKTNLASQAISFMKQIPPWRLADFLVLAWINSICLLSSCCGQLCWKKGKKWCFSRELERKVLFLKEFSNIFYCIFIVYYSCPSFLPLFPLLCPQPPPSSGHCHTIVCA